MNNKCNNCAKFLTCDKMQCKKITFIEAGILDKPKIIQNDDEILTEIIKKLGDTMQESLYTIKKANERLSEALTIIKN